MSLSPDSLRELFFAQSIDGFFIMMLDEPIEWSDAADKDALLEDQVRGDPALFGAGAGLVHSEALLRLTIGSHAPAGILALGSRKPHKFKGGQGTELLCFLAQALEITIFQWLDIGA